MHRWHAGARSGTGRRSSSVAWARSSPGCRSSSARWAVLGPAVDRVPQPGRAPSRVVDRALHA
eukprot:11159379-Lingulodinium_polyedra.AAC.1